MKTKTDGRRKRNSFPDEMNFFFFIPSHFKYYDDDDIFKVNGSTEFILTNITEKQIPHISVIHIELNGTQHFYVFLDRK